MRTKLDFSDLKIGDIVLTTNNKVGEIIALKSYAYLNDKIQKKAEKNIFNKETKKQFKFDNTRHSGIWYSTVTVAIEDETAEIPTYYTENLDFIEIRELIKPKKNSKLIDKIKNIFKWQV